MTYLEWVNGIYDWQYHRDKTETFIWGMIYAFRAADRQNRLILTAAFPNLAEAIKDWDSAGDNGNDLFRKLGIGKFKETEF
jgi:2-oxo-4-hydroxy-4-carboxy--5-ureidoimidazoline (OHCU) decarboxylase